MMSRVSTLFLAAALAAGTARAEDLNLERKASAEVALSISNLSGAVRVIGWDKASIELHADLSDGVDKVDVSGEGDAVDVRVIPRHDSRRGDASAELTLHVPRGGRIRVNTVSAEVVATDLRNSLSVETVSGDVVVTGRLREANLRTVSGEVKLEGVGARVTVVAVSGDVVIMDASGELEVSSVSGDVSVSGEAFTRARVKSVSGELRFSGDLAREGSYEFESHSGDIDIGLGPASSAQVEASTFSGDIMQDAKESADEQDDDESCSDEPHHGRHGRGPGRSARFVVGSPGGPWLRVKTFSGDIQVHKR